MAANYRIRALLTTGGMAEVYLGTMTGSEGFERPVAIKRLLPHLAKSERVAKMFASEAKLASFLHHQNIVQVLDVGRAGDDLYITMELVNGWDLGVLLAQAQRLARPFPSHLAAYVAHQVTLALGHAYGHKHNGQKVIAAHRDVSPSNVMVSVEGEVKVADFGIARLEAAPQVTEPGTFKGKYAYAAPEVLMGEPATSSSDQFALGLVLYEMLANRHPYGAQADPIVYARKISTESAPPLTDAPQTLRSIVERMLSKKSGARFPTIEACGRALAEYLARCGQAANAPELAGFVSSLQPPPPPLDAHAMDTVVSHGPATLDLRPVKTPPQASGPSGVFQPQGPQLDANGRLVAAGEPPPASGATPPAPGFGSGTRELVLEPVAALAEQGLELDLSERFVPHPNPEPENAEPLSSPRRFPLRGVIVVAILAAIGVGLWLGRGSLKSSLAEVAGKLPGAAGKAPPGAIVVTFESEPSGARVVVAGQELGVTPLSVDNDYPEAAIDVRMEKAGYRPWRGTFDGGKAQRVNAKLSR